MGKKSFSIFGLLSTVWSLYHTGFKFMDVLEELDTGPNGPYLILSEILDEILDDICLNRFLAYGFAFTLYNPLNAQ